MTRDCLETKTALEKDTNSNLFSKISKTISSGFSGIFGIRKPKISGQQIFAEYVRSRYNMEDRKLSKLLQLVDFQYKLHNKTKTREQILVEEEKFSGDYRVFQEYVNENQDNFVGKAIVDYVNKTYKENNGKKSTARIFAELKRRKDFRVGMRYNSDLNRYEVYVNDFSVDIRNLQVHKFTSIIQ